MEWLEVQAYASSFDHMEILPPVVPFFLLAPKVVVLMPCVHHSAADDKKVLSHLAFAFTVAYAVAVDVNYSI